MKIVLFGPERRIGAWQNDKVIDLNHALANYLRDQRGETNAQAHADEKIPPRLERFIGVIYRPETERWSHYSQACLPRQFDAFVWFDETNAVTPLPAPPQSIGPDETYPFGL